MHEKTAEVEMVMLEQIGVSIIKERFFFFFFYIMFYMIFSSSLCDCASNSKDLSVENCFF